jgi:acyl-phosphate glycerol 3-phosphate acyltransferase
MFVAPYLSVLAAYLLGAVPFGYLVARLRGVDIFKAGSGNIGATNVGRVLGRKFGLFVFVLDFLKGAVPVAVVRYLLPEQPWAAVAAGLAAFVGHMFPVYLRFRGGKGVATGTGAVAVLLPGPTVVAALVWVSILASTRYVSLASVLAAVALAAARLLSTPEPFAEPNRILTAFSLLAALLVTVRHRSNLARLVRGTENRVTDSPRLRMAARVLHVLALGLWFGGGMFFSFVVTPLLFVEFGKLAESPPEWLPLRTETPSDPGAAAHVPLGTRLAGTVLAQIFPIYFAVQGACGVVALATAWGWTLRPPRGVNRLRFALIAVAFLLVVVGWPVAGKVESLRQARYAGDSDANAAFDQWHKVNLYLNLGTLALAGVATAMAARLPYDLLPAPPPAKAE